MAVIRETNIDDSIQNYIATIGFFCVISCTILMLRFLGFKASLNILDGKKNAPESDDIPTVSVNGAYRVNRGEFYDSSIPRETTKAPPKKILPAVKLPPASKADSTERHSKSTSDLRQAPNVPSILRKSTPEISDDPRGTNNNKESADAKKINQKDVQKQKTEQSKLNKKQIEEQKKRDKLAAQEQAKQVKLRKEREKLEAQQRAKEAKRIEKEKKEKESKAKSKNNDKGKSKAEVPKPPIPKAQVSQAQVSQAQVSQAQQVRAQPQAQGSSQARGPQYSTNTLESSISKTSGPPPYTAQEKRTKVEPVVVLNENDNTGNTSFAPPVDSSGSSWDMIAQYREQMNRKPVASGGRQKQMVLDLQFNSSSATTNEDKGSEV